MLQRLAFLGTEPASVRWGDYGEDLFGGSRILHETPRRQRIPIWRRSSLGPPCNFDFALHLDFEDWDGFRAYADDPAHDEASRINKLESWDEWTARVRWPYEAESPPTRTGAVKHVAMFLWADEVSDVDRARALDAAESLVEADGVSHVVVGHNEGDLTTDYDWILDVELPDRESADRLLAGPLYSQAMETVAGATKYEWTARMTHLMRGTPKTP
jgi:hypothetical protein